MVSPSHLQAHSRFALIYSEHTQSKTTLFLIPLTDSDLLTDGSVPSLGNISWPPQFPRTDSQEHTPNNRFETTLRESIDNLADELERVGSDDWRLGTGVEHQQRNPKYPYPTPRPMIRARSCAGRWTATSPQPLAGQHLVVVPLYPQEREDRIPTGDDRRKRVRERPAAAGRRRDHRRSRAAGPCRARRRSERRTGRNHAGVPPIGGRCPSRQRRESRRVPAAEASKRAATRGGDYSCRIVPNRPMSTKPTSRAPHQPARLPAHRRSRHLRSPSGRVGRDADRPRVGHRYDLDHDRRRRYARPRRVAVSVDSSTWFHSEMRPKSKQASW